MQLRKLSLEGVECEACSKALLILTRAHDSADAQLKAYDLARLERAGTSKTPPRGMTTDEEQDLLRGMLVFAAAGLDSMVKQLVRDTLRSFIHADARARSGLQRFIAGQLRSDDPDFLVRALSSPAPTESVIDEYVDHLTGSSLQSAAELARATSALGLEPSDVGIDFEALRSIFDVRNKIIHELDINFDSYRRVQNVRRVEFMTRSTNALLEIGEEILKAVDEQLRDREPSGS